MMLDQVIDEWIETNCTNQEEVDTARKGIDANLARIRRKAKAEALREAAEDAEAVRDAHCKVWPWPGSQEWFEVADEEESCRLAYEHLMGSPWGWLLDRADRMEAGEQ